MLRSQFGAVRYVWNHMLALRTRYQAIYGRWASPMRLKAKLAVMKKRPRWAWLRQHDSVALQEALRNMQKSLTRAFEHGTGFPVFKSRNGKQSSFHCTSLRVSLSPSNRLKGNAELRVPKVGTLRLNLHREVPPGWTLKSVTLSRSRAGRLYASLAYETGQTAPAKPAILRADRVKAGDLGVNMLLTLSDGQEFENPRREREFAARIRKLHKQLSRKRKGSKNQEKARVRLARAYEKQRNARCDAAHKISRDLVSENQAFGFESLNVKGMMRGGRGLARSLAAVALGDLVRMTEYKAERAGTHVVRVDRWFPSSKTCNPCGHVHGGLGRGERGWVCPACGAALSRDLNAAHNLRDETIRELRAAGLAVLGT